MNVAAIIVTRGDQDLTPVLASLPEEWEVLIWDNGGKKITRWGPGVRGAHTWVEGWCEDVSVYGRYAAIAHTDAELIYVQDDDVIVSEPQVLVYAWDEMRTLAEIEQTPDPAAFVVCNMPQEFRHEFYEEHALVGFGACFHRDAPVRAFTRLWEYDLLVGQEEWFQRTCDIVFTALTPRVLVDVPKTDLPWAHYETRLWKQPGHVAERVRMLDLVRAIA